MGHLPNPVAKGTDHLDVHGRRGKTGGSHHICGHSAQLSPVVFTNRLPLSFNPSFGYCAPFEEMTKMNGSRDCNLVGLLFPLLPLRLDRPV